MTIRTRITEVKSVKQIFNKTLKEFGEVTGRLAALNYPKRIEGVITGAALITEPHNYAKTIVGSDIFRKLEGMTPKKVQHMKAEFIGRREQIGPLLERLLELDAPVEVLHGTLDTLVPKSDAQILIKALGGNARYREIKGGTHYMEPVSYTHLTLPTNREV